MVKLAQRLETILECIDYLPTEFDLIHNTKKTYTNQLKLYRNSLSIPKILFQKEQSPEIKTVLQNNLLFLETQED
jgi:hypothetical protein